VCAIGGLILFPTGPVKAEWLKSFLEDLAHRGPDDQGWVSFHRGRCRQGRGVEEEIVSESLLIHRRLSIIDVSKAGHQPMRTPDGRYWVTYNGEIYNFMELREELQSLGHTFRSHSDTEVLLVAYTEWGVHCLTRLVGMFAFAILDTQTRRLLLARDCFGIKPLYYALWQEGFAFSSEISPLLDLPGVTREVNPQRLYDYLRCGVSDHGADTFFAHIKQLPPGHYLEVLLDQPQAAQPVRYWDVDLTQKSELSFEDAAKHLRDLFVESVRLHLRSDVPVGAALSGGIDSSSIVMVMRHLQPQLDIHAFSYVAQDPMISEERWIDLVGKAAKVTVHKVGATPQALLDDLDHLIRVQGEPFISTSIYAQSRVFRQAQVAGIKVMLDGQGADEMLAGYATYRLTRVSSLLRHGHWGEAMQLGRSGPGPSWKVFPRAMAWLAPSAIQATLRRVVGRDAFPSSLNADWCRDHGVRDFSSSQIATKDLMRQELYRSLTETSLPQLLHYEDRNSMSYSIESRVPFLTPELASFVFSLPEEYLLPSNGTTKAVFRKAMRGIVPDAILDRRDKLGFPTPERDWLLSNRPWIERVLSSDTARQIRALNIERIHREWGEILQGTRAFDSRVWRWINLILWARQFSVASSDDYQSASR
jgi:asparagine synthase (glutamine-hydrolysing)